MALINQIATLVNDSVQAALGQAITTESLNTSNLVSMGRALSDANKYEAFYKQLTNRIVKTLYYVRTYEANPRGVLMDEHEYGAFVQKVYYALPTAGDNPTYQIPDGTGAYKQQSPYDVSTTIGVSADVFGGKGTWSIEFVRPMDQIKTAFISPSEMAAFIDGIYVTADNAFKMELEQAENLAVNTGAATCYASTNNKTQYVDLLANYNTMKKSIDTKWTDLAPRAAMIDADFLKFASKEINKTVKRMQRMNTVFNAYNYPTFTPPEKMVVEVLQDFASATASYLQADTYHDEMVALPHYNEVPYWQYNDVSSDVLGSGFAINVSHKDINDGEDIMMTGVVCMVRDIDAVACYFGERKSWEMVNPRSDVVIHGEKAVKGYGVDKHCNFVVFTIGGAIL